MRLVTSRLFSLSVLLLITLNLIAGLFPVLPKTGGGYLAEEFHKQLSWFVVVIFTPLIIFVTLAQFMRERFRGQLRDAGNNSVLLIAVLAFLAFEFSSCMNNFRGSLFVPPYFLLVSLFLFVLAEYFSLPRRGLPLIIWALALWSVLPVVAVIVRPSLYGVFVTDLSFHGFADSRIGYGLWAGVLIILLINKPTGKWRNLILIAAMIGIYLSISRAALFGLALAYMYYYSKQRAGSARCVIKRGITVSMVCLLVLFSWKLMLGRAGAFDLLLYGVEPLHSVVGVEPPHSGVGVEPPHSGVGVEPPHSGVGVEPPHSGVDIARTEIAKVFIEFIRNNWLWGYGAQMNVNIPGIGNDVPAHNFLIQGIANYGVVAAGLYLLYLASIFKKYTSSGSRMLLIFLIIFSLVQPSLLPPSFFSPIAMIVFLAIVMAQKNYQPDK